MSLEVDEKFVDLNLWRHVAFSVTRRPLSCTRDVLGYSTVHVKAKAKDKSDDPMAAPGVTILQNFSRK